MATAMPIVAAGLAVCSVAVAEPTSDPNPINRQLEERKLSKGMPKGHPLQRTAPSAVTGAGQGPSFLLRSVSISGATAVTELDLKREIAEFVGRTVGPVDLAAVATRLSDVYQKRGYFLSRASIEPQDVASGHLRIRMIEGYVREVHLSGANLERFALPDALAPITTERPLTLARFERTLLLAADTSGLQITDTALEEISGTPGAYRLTVTAVARPVSATVSVDNRTSDGLAPVQAIVAGSLSSLLLPRDELSLATATTTRGPGELAFVGGAYEIPLATSGLSIGAFASRSVLAPGDERKSVDTETRSDIAGVKIAYTALRSLEQTLRLTLAIAAVHAEETTIVGLTYDDRIYSATVGASYQVLDRFGGVNFLQVFARQGLDLGDANERWDAYSSRYDGSGIFSKATVFASRYQPIDQRFYVRASAIGQIAADPLLSSEQLYLGGAQFGRAYHSGEFGGDHGAALALEAGVILPWHKDFVRRTEVFGFVDGGFVGYRGRELDGHTSILSAGAGIRATLGEHHTAQLELALPIGVGPVDDHGGKVFFSITSGFQGCARLPSC